MMLKKKADGIPLQRKSYLANFPKFIRSQVWIFFSEVDDLMLLCTGDIIMHEYYVARVELSESVVVNEERVSAILEVFPEFTSFATERRNPTLFKQELLNALDTRRDANKILEKGPGWVDSLFAKLPSLPEIIKEKTTMPDSQLYSHLFTETCYIKKTQETAVFKIKISQKEYYIFSFRNDLRSKPETFKIQALVMSLLGQGNSQAKFVGVCENPLRYVINAGAYTLKEYVYDANCSMSKDLGMKLIIIKNLCTVMKKTSELGVYLSPVLDDLEIDVAGRISFNNIELTPPNRNSGHFDKRSIAYQAPEVLLGSNDLPPEFTKFTEVFAFGLLMNEVLKEDVALLEIENLPLIGKIFESRGEYRPDFYSGYKEIQNIIEGCTKTNPEERLSFSEIKPRISMFQKIYSERNAHSDNQNFSVPATVGPK